MSNTQLVPNQVSAALISTAMQARTVSVATMLLEHKQLVSKTLLVLLLRLARRTLIVEVEVFVSIRGVVADIVSV